MVATQLAFSFYAMQPVISMQPELPLLNIVKLPYSPHVVESVASFRSKGFPLEYRLVFDESRATFLRSGRIVVSRPYDFAFFDHEGVAISLRAVSQLEIDEAVAAFEAEEKVGS